MSQKGTVPGKKGSASPKTGQEGVGASEKGRFRARRGWRVQKRTVPGKKGSARPNRAGTGPKKDGCRQEGVSESKNRAGRGQHVQNRAGRGRRVPKRGRKWSARPKTGQEGHGKVGVSKKRTRNGEKGSAQA